MASYRQTGQMVSSAEMCDMSMYKDARIDWIRPCTLPVKRVCEMMVTCPDKWSPEEMRAELGSCSKAHSKLIKEAKAGQAFDRHLSALVALAEKGGGSAPPICKDPAFSALNRVVLFTSNINSPSIETIYFNPAFQGGFSITYNLEMDRLGLMVAANKGEQDVKAFVENFETSMLDIREVLEGRKPVCTSQQRHRGQTDD